MRPHRQQPTRLPRPWDSPGKNTGVGCHFLLQCMKVKNESEVAQSCPTLSDPMDCSLPSSSIHGIFLQEYWSGVPLPSPTDSTVHDKTIISNPVETTMVKEELKEINHDGPRPISRKYWHFDWTCLWHLVYPYIIPEHSVPYIHRSFWWLVWSPVGLLMPFLWKGIHYRLVYLKSTLN